jgi:hypothetical protein
VVGSSGSKTAAHIEDVEAELLPGFDGDGRAWTTTATVNWTSVVRAGADRVMAMMRRRNWGGSPLVAHASGDKVAQASDDSSRGGHDRWREVTGGDRPLGHVPTHDGDWMCTVTPALVV